MAGGIAPWSPSKSQEKLARKVGGYGLIGAGLIIASVALSRIKALSNGGPRAFRAAQTLLIGGGALSEVAAVASLLKGTSPPKSKETGSTQSSTSLGEITSAAAPSPSASQKTEAKRGLLKEMKRKKPRMEVITKYCNTLGEAINEPLGAKSRSIRPENTLLHEAVYAKNKAVARALIKAGARIDQPGGEGWTPFHVALLSFTDPADAKIQREIVQLFLSQGARLPTLGPSWPIPLLELKSEEEAIQFQPWIESKLTKQLEKDRKLLKEVSEGAVEGVQGLLEAGCPVDVPDPATGRTSLQLAVVKGDAEMVACLLTACPQINYRDQRGLTALELAIAAEEPNLEIAKGLIAAGSELFCRLDGRTQPLAYTTKHKKLFSLLVESLWQRQLESLSALGALGKARAPAPCSLDEGEKKKLQKGLLKAIQAKKPDLALLTSLAEQLGSAVDEPLPTESLTGVIYIPMMPPKSSATTIAIWTKRPQLLDALLKGGADPNLIVRCDFRGSRLRLIHEVLKRIHDSTTQEALVRTLMRSGACLPNRISMRLFQKTWSEGQRLMRRQLALNGLLYDAAATGDESFVQGYIETRFPIERAVFDKALDFAVFQRNRGTAQGSKAVINQLLQAGAKPKCIEQEGSPCALDHSYYAAVDPSIVNLLTEAISPSTTLEPELACERA